MRRSWSDTSGKTWSLLSGPSWIPKTGTQTPGKRLSRKPLMRRQKHYYNPSPVPGTWTHGVPKGTSPLRRMRKTPVERISLPAPLLLTHLVRNSHLLPSKLLSPTQRRTRTTSKKVLNAERANEDRIAATTPLQWLLTPALSKKK